MVPKSKTIIKVKLASVGYKDFETLSLKFETLYLLCKEQLSNQRHYDFGLRNILSVLRTAGRTKREEPNVEEEMLVMRTLRDMNLSKLVFDDTKLFNSLIRDIFPKQLEPKKKTYEKVEKACLEIIEERKYIVNKQHSFQLKIIQLYET